jgi:hypothetical protein
LERIQWLGSLCWRLAGAIGAFVQRWYQWLVSRLLAA